MAVVNEKSDLRHVDTHFAFGENWASYAAIIGEEEIESAVAHLRRLLGTRDLRGRSFLDIGCGSGLHSLAAVRLGASSVVALDIDDHSVETTRAVLARFAPEAQCRVERRSIFDVDRTSLGSFDVVYSWGVLHHTGDMMTALGNAAGLVADGGVFLFALYRRTYLCRLWRMEKRWYSSAGPRAQRMVQRLYIGWYRVLVSLRRTVWWMSGRRGSIAGRPSGTEKPARARGMDFYHDVHDWLGGYPYESILPDDVDRLMRSLGLSHQASFLCAGTRGRTHGLVGSGCDEYRYAR